ncbi:MAG: N-formimino-L-glutamate deiminase [Actinobacteria bacterium ADurb.BinA094]|nr:MAG: N-formimino-L-glutamate deiminase [Actinobacteria bacterium ADurb.BinA094]
MVGGQRAVARRQRRAAHVGELVGVQLHRQAQLLGGVEDACRLLGSEGDAFGERVDRVG